MKIGSIFKLPIKITLRPNECQTCEYSRERVIGKETKLICAFENPRVDLNTSQAVWPIVEANDSCRRHKYDSKRE